MSDCYIGEIRLFAGLVAPIEWAFCDGRLLRIADNTALFTLLETRYGGDGQSTFALPDLRGRVPLHAGQRPDGPQFLAGMNGGQETMTLFPQHMPSHNHALPASQDRASPAYGQGSAGAFANAGGAPVYGLSGGGGANLRADTIAVTGGNQPHNNMAPYLGLNFIISLSGNYPPRG